MVIGHEKQWKFLTRTAELNKLAHAYLFSGQEKLGKKKLVLEFVKWLFGEEVEKKQHPDFIFIEPVKKEIQIFQVRECIWKLALKPSLAPYKVAIIDQAHCLNQEAQNCLLKTLEEPKGNTILFLIAEYPEMLVPTILSRCQIIKFYPVPKKEIEDYFRVQEASEKEIEKILKISIGKPGLAIDFIANSQKLKTQEKITSDLIKILNSDLAFRFQYIKDLTKKGSQDLKEILEVWQKYFREILISKINQENPKYPFNKLINILKLIQNTNFLISKTNINPRLTLEILMLEIP